MRSATYLRLFPVTVLLLCHPQAHAQSIKVLVLDALNGKPQAGVKVTYYCTRPYRNEFPIKSVMTNSDGLADVPYSCAADAKIEIGALPPSHKEQCGELAPLSFDQISANGMISDPRADGGIWCPNKISKKLKLVPGQVVIFVKKPTWFQSHVAG